MVAQALQESHSTDIGIRFIEPASSDESEPLHLLIDPTELVLSLNVLILKVQESFLFGNK